MSINVDVRVFLEEMMEGADMVDYEYSFNGIFWIGVKNMEMYLLERPNIQIRKKESQQSKQPV